MSQLHKYIVLQLFVLFIASQVIDYQWNRLHSDNLSSSLNSDAIEYFSANLVDVDDTSAKGRSEDNDNDTTKNEDLELEEEPDDCDPFKSYTNDFFGYVRMTYSIDYKEQYTEQFHPEIVPPPPRA